jgi:hypothetical protein
MIRPRAARAKRSRSLAVALVCIALSGAGVAACGDTRQDQPIAHNTLETLLVAPYPVYWLGGSFHGMQITEASHDPGGAFSLQYGDCLEGGQGTCVPPLRVVTSPDNSFVPGGDTPQRSALIRGVRALVASAGQTIELPTGGVVVAIYTRDRTLAAAAAQSVVAIDRPGSPGGPLPAALPDTGFGSSPLPSQMPSPLRPLPQEPVGRGA